MVLPEEALKGGLASLYTSEEFSDFNINCGPYSFKVHKAVICAQSEYFRAACRNFREGETNSINLKTSDTDATCDDPEAIRCMVYYFYHLNYEAKEMLEWPGLHIDNFCKELDGNMLVHAQVFAAAVKYQVPALRDLATTKFSAAVELFSVHPWFAKTIQTVYTTTADDIRELRDIVTDKLIEQDKLLDNEEVAETVRSLEGLSWELLRKSNGARASVTKKPLSIVHSCWNCGRRILLAHCRECDELVPNHGLSRCGFCGFNYQGSGRLFCRCNG